MARSRPKLESQAKGSDKPVKRKIQVVMLKGAPSFEKLTSD
jgi:hypothetical protein